MNDLIEILQDTNLSNVEIVEILNDILHNADKSQEELDEFARDNLICPQYDCYCEDFYVEKSLENEDADGNRGINKDILICRNCNRELYE